jgi:hypothetical protein
MAPVVLLGLVLAAGACARDGEAADCGRLWRRLDRCGLTGEPLDRFLAQCRPEHPHTADRIACSGPTDCAVFAWCDREAARKEDVRARLALMDAAVARGDYFVAVRDCGDARFVADPRVDHKCDDTLRRSFAHYRGLVLAHLAEPEPPSAFIGDALHQVALLQDTADLMGPDQRRETLDLFDRVARRNLGAALTWCEANRPRARGAVAVRCGALPAEAHEASRAAVLAAQQGPPTDHFVMCYELKRTAALLGDEKKREAERLCTELDLRAYVDASLPAVELYMAQRRPKNLALECMPPYIDAKFRLDEMTSPYAEAQKKRLFDACYSRLGVLVLDYLIPRTLGECEFTVLLVYRAVQRYGLTDPELQKRLRRVEKPCAKSVVLHQEYL